MSDKKVFGVVSEKTTLTIILFASLFTALLIGMAVSGKVNLNVHNKAPGCVFVPGQKSIGLPEEACPHLAAQAECSASANSVFVDAGVGKDQLFQSTQQCVSKLGVIWLS